MDHHSWIMEPSLNAALFLYVLMRRGAAPRNPCISPSSLYEGKGELGGAGALLHAPFLVRLTGFSETDIHVLFADPANPGMVGSDAVCGYAHVSHRGESRRRTCRRVHGCIEERRPNDGPTHITIREAGAESIDHIDTINSLQNLLRRYQSRRRRSYLRRIP
jgi:hypothetical protein